MLKETSFDGVPSNAQIINAIRKYHVFKKSCLMSFYDCQGNRHNKLAFAGPYDECGRIDVFGVWKDNVTEKKSKVFIDRLMDQYEIPVHHAPDGMEDEINKFYQGRYGMFTCHDTLQRIGKVRYAEDLIEYWQRNKQDQRYTWYLAIAFVVSEKRDGWEKIEKYRKSYKESKSYQSYIRNHPNHEHDVSEILTRAKAKDFFDKKDSNKWEEDLRSKTDNLFKKVRFYQSEKAGKYAVPTELKGLTEVKEESKLRDLIS